jgi:hypothetical protein
MAEVVRNRTDARTRPMSRNNQDAVRQFLLVIMERPAADSQ